MLRFKRPPQLLKFAISQKIPLPLVLKQTVAQVAEEEKVEEEVLKTPPPPPPPPLPTPEEDLNQKLNWEMEILNKLTVQQLKESGVDGLGYKVSQNPVAQQCRVEIESLIERGADVNHRSSSGFAAIHFATFFNDISFVRFLIANSADVGARTAEGQTPLHLAVSTNNLINVLVVLQAMADDKILFTNEGVNQKNQYLDTPLHYAARENIDVNISQVLVKEGADFNLPNQMLTSPLMIARVVNPEALLAMRQSLAERVAIDDLPTRSLQRLATFFTVRWMAISLTEVEEVATEELITKGMDLLVKQVAENKSQANKVMADFLETTAVAVIVVLEKELAKSCFERASQNLHDSMKLMVRMIDAGADVNTQSVNKKFSAAHFSTYLDLPEITQQLVERGADLNLPDKLGITPVQYSEMRDLKRIAPERKIVKKDPTEELIKAIKQGEEDRVRYLITKKIDINAKDSEGSSILSLAAKSENKELLKLVLACKELEFSEVVGEIEKAIKGNKAQLLSTILAAEEVKNKFENHSAREQSKMVEGWRQTANKFTNKANINKIKEIIGGLVEEDKKEVEPEVRVGFKKLKEQRKIENELKAKEEAQQKEAEKQRIKDALTNQAQEIDRFLKGEREINSLRDLPQFLQPIILKLLDEGCEVLIKGSAAYPKSELTRIPGDLDLEILVKGMSEVKNTQIRKFTSENFGLKVNDEDIRRIPNKDGSTTLIVNFTDPILHNLDITLYDPDHLPLDHLSWITSKEKKIKFSNSGNAERVPLSGFNNFLSKKKPDFNSENRLLINSKASGVVFRLCFLEVVGQLTAAELNGAISTVVPYEPRDLLAKNLKLKVGEDPSKIIQKEITDFAESHRFSEEENSRFLESLCRLTRSTRTDIPPQFRKMCEAIEEIKNSKPSNSLNANSAANLGVEKVIGDSR